jgi:hypothetical protein
VDSLLQLVVPLAGVALGAALSHWASESGERRRWRHERSVRWDEPRLLAYAAYGHAVKRVVELALRMCAARGFEHFAVPLEPSEGLPLLAAAEAERGETWERVLLLGSPTAIEQARLWHNGVWELQRVARGAALPAADWRALFLRVGALRDAFYDAARADLGIGQAVPRGASPWDSAAGGTG